LITNIRLFVRRLQERLGHREDAIAFINWLLAKVDKPGLLALYNKVMSDGDAIVAQEREHVHGARPLTAETEVADWEEDWWPEDDVESAAEELNR